jgi:NCS1 family nucleobase:cation symporter-1
VVAFIPAAFIAIALALAPGFDSVSPFSWLIGAAIAGMLGPATSGRRTTSL